MGCLAMRTQSLSTIKDSWNGPISYFLESHGVRHHDPLTAWSEGGEWSIKLTRQLNVSYDYAGSWSTTSGHQANLFDHGGQNELSTERAISYYKSQGVPSNKLVIGSSIFHLHSHPFRVRWCWYDNTILLIGLPLYGRSFMETKGIGSSFRGVGKGSWEAGSF